MRREDRVAAFEADIATSPGSLARLLDGWQADAPHVEAGQRVAFVGLGSSRFAAEVVAPVLRRRGAGAWVDIAGPTVTPEAADVVIAISASGGTPEVVDVAARARGAARVIAVTDRAGSRLAEVADAVVLLEAGAERSGIACRSFRATIAALALVTGVATTSGLRPAVESLAALHAGRGQWLAPLADALHDAHAIDVVAPRPLLGVADQAALMLREAPRLPAHATETADWLHVGVYLAWAGHAVLRYPGSPADETLAVTLARRGSRLVDAPSADPDPLRRAIADSLVAEVLAAELWRRASARDK